MGLTFKSLRRETEIAHLKEGDNVELPRREVKITVFLIFFKKFISAFLYLDDTAAVWLVACIAIKTTRLLLTPAVSSHVSRRIRLGFLVATFRG